MSFHLASSPLANVRALVFDVFGTVFNWHTPLTRALQAHARPNSTITESQWALFAHKWRQGMHMYRQAAVQRGKYFGPETIMLRTLEELVRTESIDEGWDEEKMVQICEAWSAQEPWGDTVAGLERLKTQYTVWNRASGVTWDYILTSDLMKAIKPAPESYKTTIRLLGLKPEEIALVAAHDYDLEAAKLQGMRSIYVVRETEDSEVDKSSLPQQFDLVVDEGGLIALASKLGIQT